MTVRSPAFSRLASDFLFRTGCFDHPPSRNTSFFLTASKCQSYRRFFSIDTNKWQYTASSSGGGKQLLDVYMDKVKNGELRQDAVQIGVVKEYQTLADELQKYRSVAPSTQGMFSRLFGSRPKIKPPQGLYVYGTVGTGKTMLMDMFYDNVAMEKKRRVHFNAFMLDVHNRIHKFKQSLPRTQDMRKGFSYDPIGAVAKELSAAEQLLCFDEFQVTDIADAMILKRLFTLLFESGVIVVATSNRPPDDLYKNGLQRAQFVPFIAILKEYCRILSLNSGIDYRTISKGGSRKSNYFLTTQPDSERAVDRIFKTLTATQNDIVRPRKIRIKGREVDFAKTCGKILDATFEELCLRPLGAIDYLFLCQTFDTFIIRNVPALSLTMRDPLKRFISLIDTLYDQKTKLVILADVPAKDIFQADTVGENPDEKSGNMLMDELKFGYADENAKASIFTGDEELFAVGRTVSRLLEMQREEYWDQASKS